MRTTVEWVRPMTVEGWLTETRSHSMVAAMPHEDRQALLGALGEVLRSWFGADPFPVPHDTRLWTARRRPG